ncbi:hypothetical protein BH11PSE9_BH11PSE9_39030 [soil metagenome]
MILKPQDFLVALKLLALGEQHWTYARLANDLGLSASETHAAVQRGLVAGLLSDASLARAYVIPPPAPPLVARERGLHEPEPPLMTSREFPRPRSSLDSAAVVNTHNLAEFALHGAKYAFAPDRLPSGPGVPTGHAAPALKALFADGHEPLVWPDAQGSVRGEGIAPLHPCVPAAALRDPALYELLALFDALRAGRARERNIASDRLQTLIDPPSSPSKRARRG